MSSSREQGGVHWRKSSRSGANGQCVEVAAVSGKIGMRDSKAPGAGHLAISHAAFADMVARIKSGREDARE
ncbi:DUF397 domain-containing protein [Actinomadura rugatobispora]|uniref:DUF397 domain-containing protein n=1 Tax=Actinomadura rugatobispora TaxID=1994 RepID=A0ABW1AI86_9ACTN|nr:hypothetical protein GCM10010200_031000 [Actinomadura rugatobispora]